MAIYASIVLTRFEKWGGLSLVAWDAEHKQEVFISKGVRLFVTIPDLGWLMLLALLVVAAPLALYGLASWKKNESFLAIANRAVFISILLQIMTLVMFLLRARDGSLSLARRRWIVCHQPGGEPVHSFGAGRQHLHLAALSAAALAASGSGALAAER